MPGYIKAGKILRVLGWLQAVLAGCGALFTVMMLAMPQVQTDRRGMVVTVALVATVLCALSALLQLWVGRAVLDHKNWGRTVGIVIGVLNLPGFPIGTVVGGFIIYYLVSGWDNAAAPAAPAA